MSIKGNVVFFSYSLFDKSVCNSARLGELEFEANIRREDRKEKVLILEAQSWMKSVKFEQLEMVVDIKSAMEGKTAPKDEVMMLMILVTREYSPDTQIPLHKTLKTINKKVENDSDYIASLMGEFTIPYEDIVEQVKKVTKLHRLSGIVLPTLEKSGLMISKKDSSGKNAYFWQNDHTIELIFKKAIKHKQESLDVID